MTAPLIRRPQGRHGAPAEAREAPATRNGPLRRLAPALLLGGAALAGCGGPGGSAESADDGDAGGAAALPSAGAWRASLDSPGGPLTFGIDIAEAADGGLTASLRNGDEVRPAGAVTRVKGGVVIEIPPYRSRLFAEVVRDGEALVGRWERDLGEGYRAVLPFAAVSGAASAPDTELSTDATDALSGRWRVDFADDDEVAVGLFEVDADGTARGTFLTTLGDYRYLDGRAGERGIALACFDGAHAFLFVAALQEDGSLEGDFWSRDSYHDTWTAVRDDDAALPDDFALTAWTGAADLGDLRFPDLDGEPRALDDAAFMADARLLVAFGTWCPNCQDLTEALGRLEAAHPDLSIVGIAFELGEDPERWRDAVQGYVDHHGIDWPVLLGGTADKGAASAALPVLDRLRAYPTTVFMDRDGTVTAVHTGFSGPATGDRHDLLMERFETEISALEGGR